MIDEINAKKYCRDDISLIKNYAEALADTTQTWFCHHVNGEPFTGFCKDDLIKMKMYYNRPASELMFVTLSMHNTIHRTGVKFKKSKPVSDETKKKMSDNNCMHREEVRAKMSASCKGRIPWNKGKRGIYSDETIAKMRKPKSEETKLKISLAKRGKHVNIKQSQAE